MRYITDIIAIILFTSCLGSPQSQKQSAVTKQFSTEKLEYKVDSLAWGYKESGNAKYNAGDKRGALGEYTKAIERDQFYAIAYYNRAILKSEMGNKDGAIEDYTKVIELDPSDADAYFSRAIANAGIGKTEKAISDYSKSVEIDPLKAEAYYGRAFEKDVIGDYKGAIADYSKTIEIDSLYISAYLNRGVTKHEMEDYLGEISDYRLGIKMCINTDKKQSLANLYNNLGRILYDLKRFKESTEAYGDGIKCFPDDYKLYYGRGLARNQSGDKKGACEDWRKSSKLGCFEADALLPLCDDCETDKAPK